MPTLNQTLTVEEKIDALSALVNTPGWQLVLEFIKSTDDLAMHHLLRAEETPDVRTFVAGKLNGIRELAAWPTKTLNFLRAGLERSLGKLE